MLQGNPDYIKKVHTTSTISKYTADTAGTTEPLTVTVAKKETPYYRHSSTNVLQ